MECSTQQTDSRIAPHQLPRTAGQKNRAKSGAYFNERNVNQCNKAGNERNHPYKALVTQGVAIKRKMGKKCFCVTTEILHTKIRPQKHLALTGIQLQSRI